MQTTLQPVVETQYVQQPVMTHRDVVETQFRTEAVTQQVPRTVFENVTVDEGGYQQVWVPRPVTRQVAKTVVEQQISYRTVPYQTTRRVAEYQMQSVPRQTVRYVPSAQMVYGGTRMMGAPKVMGAPCATGGCGSTAVSMPYSPTMVGSPTPVFSSPSFGTPTPAYSPTPVYSQTIGSPTPIPASSASYSPAAPIGIEFSPTPVPTPADQPIAPRSSDLYRSESRSASSGSGAFTPAPSAASAWRAATRGSFSR
jgi:hypothetical protein